MEGFRILLADVLISSEGIPERTVNIPTQDDVAILYPNGAQFIVSGLRQKICIISNNLAVSWAGSYIAARTIINELVEINNSKPLTLESLLEYFNQLDQPLHSKGVSFIILIGDPTTNKARFVGLNSESYDSQLFGKVFYCGSGGHDFVSILNHFEQEYPRIASERDSIGALDIASIFVSTLLSYDFTDLRSLQTYYGGGYELACFKDGIITKENNLTYTFWYVKVQRDGTVGISRPIQIHNYKYLDDVLAVRTLRMDVTFSDPTTASASLYMIQPVNKTVSDDELKTLVSSYLKAFIDPSFLSGHFINFIIQINDNNRPIGYLQLNGLWSDPPLKIFPLQKPDQFQVRCEGWFVRKIHELVNSK